MNATIHKARSKRQGPCFGLLAAEPKGSWRGVARGRAPPVKPPRDVRDVTRAHDMVTIEDWARVRAATVMATRCLSLVGRVVRHAVILSRPAEVELSDRKGPPRAPGAIASRQKMAVTPIQGRKSTGLPHARQPDRPIVVPGGSIC